MPICITQGRYTRDAIKGMIMRPEDRADAVSRLLAKAGGRLSGYYVTFGEYDFMAIAEVPNDVQAAAVLLAAASGGGVNRSAHHGCDDRCRGERRVCRCWRSGAWLQVGGWHPSVCP
jgi:uncharacterized protein with GYD domain